MLARPAFHLPLPLTAPTLARKKPPLRPHRHRPFCSSATHAKPGNLYIVSTPIGHLGDLTPRAASILRSATVIAAEDTRVTGSLLRAAGASAPTLTSCHEHNWRSRVPGLVRRLAGGDSVALVADAGTPCVSDPGAQLVAAAVEAGVRVVPVPGACAAVAALVASALPVGEFSFVGFLPRAGAARSEAVARVAGMEATVVLYEAPHRLAATLIALRDGGAGGRKVCLAREVTKKWEEFLRFGSVEEACDWVGGGDVQPRGEFTIVLGPKPIAKVVRDDLAAYSSTNVDLVALTRALIREGVPVSSVARSVAAATQVPKKLVYSFAMEFKDSLQEIPGGTSNT